MPKGEGMWRARSDRTGEASCADEFLRAPPRPGEIDRREFVGLLGTIAALAAGCRRKSPEAIVPRVQGAARAAGVPVEYATAVLSRGRAMGVIGETREGRPIKLEGNPLHPASLGAADAQMQAELLSLYHPSRSETILERGRISTPERLTRALAAHTADDGRGLAVLTGPVTSPTAIGMLRRTLETLPATRLYRHDPLDEPARAEGVRLALGRDADVVRRVGEAEVIVSFDDNFLAEGPARVAAARGFGARRRPREGAWDMSRVHVAEPSPTITGGSADYRLRATPRRLEALLVELARRVGLRLASEAGPALSEAERSWLEGAAADVERAGERALVLSGLGMSAEMHALALAVNERVGAFGGTSYAIEPVEALRGAPDLAALAEDLRAGDIGAVVVLGSNPAYTAPAEIGFREALGRAAFVLHAGEFVDETGELAGWHLPLAHPLESWGDAVAFDGTPTVLQPLIEPLYNGVTLVQAIGLLVDGVLPEPRAPVLGHWRGLVEAGEVGAWWERALRQGVAGAPSPPIDARVNEEAVLRAVAERDRRPPSDSLEITVRPDPTIGDGSLANNAWLQELPKPVTKLVWSNALEVSPLDAARLGLEDGDLVRIRTEAGETEGPVWVTPGQAAGCVSTTLGYGRRPAVSPALSGWDAYALRSRVAPWGGRVVALEPTGRREELVTTQHHGRMEGSEQIRTEHLDALERGKEVGEKRVPLTLYPEYEYEGVQWGMVIDLTACIACGACTIACQAENNIPVVGPEQVRLGREMHWIRVDRYFEGSEEEPDILHQPVPCMHCEKAPCEVVCPVGATQHSSDGLNEMIYNRCIGTRYCSNNCPYKVRRFNFHRYVDDAPSLRLVRNPEVTVRARGVMEKCTYCVQRIRREEREARIEGRPLEDGEVVTACQQACPTRAIIFGDINDADSAVSRARRQPHEYSLLGHLNTQPRTTYLARVRNRRGGGGA